MSRLIDADKIDFNEVFVGESEFAQDTRNAAQMLIDNQPTAFDADKVAERLEEEKKRAFKLCLGINDSTQKLKYIEKEQTIALAIEIVKGGGVE